MLEKQEQTDVLSNHIIIELQNFRRASSIAELYRRQNILKTLGLLRDHHSHCLLLKGSALAYSHYQKPYLRVRADTDLLISPGSKQAVEDCLLENGYRKSNTVSGELISHQCTFSKTENQIDHRYDIHWKLSNRNAYASRFDFEELYRQREQVNSLSEHVYRLGDDDALLHSIVHFYGHFPDERERLIWIYDLHLLCSRFTPSQWSQLVQKSADKKLDSLVTQALQLTRATFATPIPGDVQRALEKSPVRLDKIEQRRLSSPRWSRIEQFKSDWNALSVTQRCRLLKEYMLPPAEFILRQNHSRNKLLLPYFYLKRLVSGAIRLVKG